MPITPNMNLPLPTPEVTPGPAWAAAVNESFDEVDSHDHSSGKGVKINPSGLNMSSDLPMKENNLIQVRSTRYANQLAQFSAPADVGCYYVYNGEMMYRDLAGNNVQITADGGLNLSSIGTIGGDYGQPGVDASVIYSNLTKTFVFTREAGIGAILAASSLQITHPLLGEQPITLAAPSGVVSYTLTLPAAAPTNNASLLAIDADGESTFTSNISIESVTLNTGTFSAGKNLWYDSSNILRVNGGAGGVLFGNQANNATLMTLTDAGLLSIGPASLGANYSGQRHIINGGLYGGGVSNADGSARLAVGANVRISAQNAEAGRTNTVTGGGGILLNNRTNNAGDCISFFANLAGDSATTLASLIGFVRQTGAWTLGAGVTGNDNGVIHTISGSLYSGNVSSANNSGDLLIGNNARLSATTAGQGRTDTVTGGAGIRLRNNNTVSESPIAMFVNKPGDATNASPTAVAFCDYNGGWSFGSAGYNGTHVLNASLLRIDAPASTTAYQSFRINASTFGNIGAAGGTNSIISGSVAGQFCISGATQVLFSANDGVGLHGRISSTGAWTLGNSTNQNAHQASNNSITGNAVTLALRNHDSTTSSDGTYGLSIAKGSTTNTAGTNRFILFYINGGGTQSGYIGSNGANAAAFFATSDRRAKKDIETLTGGLDVVCALRPVRFKWKADGSDAVSFVAQELAEVLPSQVSRTDSGEGEDLAEDQNPWTMTESGMIPYLVQAIKELKAQLDALKGAA